MGKVQLQLIWLLQTRISISVDNAQGSFPSSLLINFQNRFNREHQTGSRSVLSRGTKGSGRHTSFPTLLIHRSASILEDRQRA